MAGGNGIRRQREVPVDVPVPGLLGALTAWVLGYRENSLQGQEKQPHSVEAKGNGKLVQDEDSEQGTWSTSPVESSLSMWDRP